MAVVFPCPSEGVYEGVPAPNYFAWDAVSNSDLTLFNADSPAHYRFAKDHPKEDDSTPDQIIGTACHTAILEPDSFDSLYFVGGKHDKRTKEGKAAHAAELEEAAGRILINSYDRQQIMACREAVMANPKARRIIEATPPNRRELSIVWRDPDTQIMCKARLDLPCEALGVIGDLKSTASAHPKRFSKSIYDFGYHRQAVQYQSGSAQNGMTFEHFVLIAFEKEPPYAVKLYRLNDEASELAQRQRRGIMARYADCLNSGCWPAYGQNLEDIGIPSYAKREIESEITL